MRWTILNGPHDPGRIDTDNKGWRWVLELGTDRRTVAVLVMGQAMIEPRSADVAAALGSDGKTEVERFLGTDFPPQSIKLTPLGRVVDGVLEPT